MAVKITDRETESGKKFRKMLEELKKLEVRVGFQSGEGTEENDVDICDIATWNELGTEHSPSRPFIRQSVDNNAAKINNLLQSEKKKLTNGTSAEQILKEIGIFQKGLIQREIVSGEFEANAESTIKKKGSSKPLIDTGKMRQSVNYVIREKGGGD